MAQLEHNSTSQVLRSALHRCSWLIRVPQFSFTKFVRPACWTLALLLVAKDLTRRGEAVAFSLVTLVQPSLCRGAQLDAKRGRSRSSCVAFGVANYTVQEDPSNPRELTVHEFLAGTDSEIGPTYCCRLLCWVWNCLLRPDPGTLLCCLNARGRDQN